LATSQAGKVRFQIWMISKHEASIDYIYLVQETITVSYTDLWYKETI